MPRKLLKRWLPHPDWFREHRSLRFLGKLLADPNLFHLTRQSTSLAVMIGLFVAFLPIFGQMPLAALLALLLRANLPISVCMVWVTNPVTIPLVFYSTYKLGAWMLQIPPQSIAIAPSLDWLWYEASVIWKPLLVGSITAGLIAGFMGYYAIYWLWRWRVVRDWQKRQRTREGRNEITPP